MRESRLDNKGDCHIIFSVVSPYLLLRIILTIYIVRQVTLMKKTVVLVGLGHCHVQVVRSWNKVLDKHWKKIVICPEDKVVYSGMVTGCIAGDYQLEEACVDVKSVCSYFGWTWVKSAAYEIIPEKQRIRCRSTRGTQFELSYDVLSINVGSETPSLGQVAVDEAVLKCGRILTVRPIGTVLSKLDRLEKELLEERSCRDSIVVVGGSYAGVELAFCLESRLRKKGIDNNVCIIESASDGLRRNFGILPAMLIRNALRGRNIQYEDSLHIVAIKEREMFFQNGTRLPYAFILLCTGAEPPKFLRQCDSLAKDNQGFVKIVVLFLEIFRKLEFMQFDKELFWEKIFACCKYYLSLISTGDKRAIGVKYGLACYGRCLWKLKDKIDRDWIHKVNQTTDASHHFCHAGLMFCDGSSTLLKLGRLINQPLLRNEYKPCLTSRTPFNRNFSVYARVQLEPDKRVPVVLLASTVLCSRPVLNWEWLELFLEFTENAFDITRGGKLIRSYPYTEWLSWRFIPSSYFPILLYFKEYSERRESEGGPSTRWHLLPVLYNPTGFVKMVESNLPRNSK
ncbi:Probable NADH dehydrogenase [Galdieria sulphuraria]|nr:Probable NADH dehydrogenase [Galdieria sulphuraria]